MVWNLGEETSCRTIFTILTELSLLSKKEAEGKKRNKRINERSCYGVVLTLQQGEYCAV
jgi:hypothetical protein